MRYLAWAWLLVVTLTVAGVAQDLPNVDRFGPQVGDIVSAFSLTDQHGQIQTLSSIMGPNGAMLVFSRSADW